MNKLPYGARYSRDEKGELHVDPEEWIDMSKTYHTDLDRDDFEPGELLPWQDMSRHLQALEHQLNTVQAMASGQNKAIESIEKHMGHVDWLNYDLGEQFKLMNGLVEKVATLEKALQTTTDSLRQAHLLIKNLQTHTIRAEEKIEVLEEETPIYNRAYVDRQFRDGELEY